MRRDVLYEYDLPVELLDDLLDTEEVLEVFYARSDTYSLVPILFTRERIVWAYPDIANAYRVYELQYIDFVSAHAKYVIPPFPTLRLNTVDGQTYRFHNLVDAKEDMRGRLITLCGILKNKVGGNWQVWHKKSFLVDEYLLDRQTHGGAENVAGLPLCEPPSSHGTDDVFEEQPIPGKGCFESNEVLFSHFPTDAEEDVFEEFAPGENAKPADSYTDKDAKIARIVEEVEADIQKAKVAEEEPPKVETELDNDAVIYNAASGKCDEMQWGEINDGGDAEILADTQYLKRLEKIEEKKPEYGPEDDDSIVYDQITVAKKKSARKEEEDTMVKMPPVYTKEDDDSIIYPTGDEEPVVITPMKKPKPEFEDIDQDEKATVSSAQRPVDTHDGASISSMPHPAYEIDRDEKAFVPSVSKSNDTHNTTFSPSALPAYEIDRDEKASVPKAPKPNDALNPTLSPSTLPAYEIDRDEKASVPKAPKPNDALNPVLSPVQRPAYEIGTDVKISPRQKTPFEEANRDVIVRMPTHEIRQEPESRSRFTNQESLSPFLKATNLQPRPGFDSAAVDKLLEELKHLRDNGIISDEEYKERSLTLFRSK